MSLQPYRNNDSDENEQMINIYALYKNHHLKQSNRMHIYQKVLTKVHSKIKLMSQYDKTETHYVIPEYQFGVPLYNQIACICFVIIKLRKNGFQISYTHPNFLWVSWKQSVNKYKFNITPTNTKDKIEEPDYKFIDKTKQSNSIKKRYKDLNDKLIASSNEPLLKYQDDDNKHVERNVLESLNYRANLLQQFNN